MPMLRISVLNFKNGGRGAYAPSRRFAGAGGKSYRDNDSASLPRVARHGSGR